MDEDISSLLRVVADLTRKNPMGAKEILSKEPKWAYTIFHALLLAGVITPDDAERVINGGPLVPIAQNINDQNIQNLPQRPPLSSSPPSMGLGLVAEDKKWYIVSLFF